MAKGEKEETPLIKDDRKWVQGGVNDPLSEDPKRTESKLVRGVPSSSNYLQYMNMTFVAVLTVAFIVSLLKSFRKWIVLICTVSMIFTFAIQASMSSALVCMIQETEQTNINNISGLDLKSSSNTNQSVDNWAFDWSKESQGWILSSFFLGYYLSQLPSGLAAARWGPKKVLVGGLAVTSLFQSLLVPATQLGLTYVYIDRAITGTIVGFLYAPTFALVGKWVPKQEISLVFGLVGSGMELGNMVSFLISTFACEIHFQGGWPILFYSLSSLGIMTMLMVTIFMSDSPFENKYISKEELDYIAGSVPKQEKKDGALQRIPAKKILKSVAVWAVVVSQLGSDWLYYFFVSLAPLYLKEVIKLTEFQTNLLSGIPFLFILPSIYISGYISDRVVTRGIMSNTKVRKINDFFCKVIPGAALIGLAFLPEHSIALVFVLNTVAASFLAFSYVSWLANPVDLAPAYTGFIVSVCEGATMWVAVVAPLFTEFVTKDKTRSQWQIVFFTTSGLQLVTFVFYAIFASGELQPWAASTYQISHYGSTGEGMEDNRGEKGRSSISHSAVDLIGRARSRSVQMLSDDTSSDQRETTFISHRQPQTTQKFECDDKNLDNLWQAYRPKSALPRLESSFSFPDAEDNSKKTKSIRD